MGRFKRAFSAHAFVHLSWIIFFLICIIILLFSAKLGTNGEVKDTINTALTLGSVFLAFFAIIQAFFSSGSFDTLISSLRTEIAELNSSSLEIKSFASLLKNSSDDLNVNVKFLRGDLVNLGSINSLSASTKQERSITNVSNGVIAAFYLASVAFRLQKKYKTEDIFDKDEYIRPYIDGVIALSSALGLIKISRIKNKDESFSILVENVDGITESLKNANYEIDFIKNVVNRVDRHFQ